MVNTPPTGTDPTTTTVAATAAINDQTQATGNLTTATAAQIQATGNLTTATTGQTQAYQGLNTVTDVVKNGLNNIESAISNASVSLDNLTALTEEQSEKFTMAAVAAVNARVAFANFSNVDYKGVSTITEQVKVLRDALETTPLTIFAKGLV